MVLSINGYIPSSMLDWEGNLASVIFIGGCNFRCIYCHNPELVDNIGLEDIDFKRIEQHLKSKSGWLDGCVITGGEPLIHNGITELLKKIKNLGLKVKLDTNGSSPGALKELIEKNLVDYVAMDIKTSFNKYHSLVQAKVDLECVKESVAALKESAIEYEFRTTVIPQYVGRNDLIEIAKLIQGCQAYFLQQFKPDQTLEPQASIIVPYSNEQLQEFAQECSKFVETKVR